MPWSPLKGRTRGAVLANSCSWDGAPLTASVRQRHHPILEWFNMLSAVADVSALIAELTLMSFRSISDSTIRPRQAALPVSPVSREVRDPRSRGMSRPPGAAEWPRLKAIPLAMVSAPIIKTNRSAVALPLADSSPRGQRAAKSEFKRPGSFTVRTVHRRSQRRTAD
jgi:hypothetical protein